MSRGRALVNIFGAVLLLILALGWALFTYRAVSVSCTRANGKVNCSESERIPGQTFWTQPVWSATADDANLTTRAVDDESNATAVIIRTKGDTDQVQFTSGLLGTNESRVDNELHQFFVVRTREPELNFELAPALTWRELAPSAAVGALALGVLLYSLLKLVAPGQTRSKMPRQSR